MTKRSMYQYSIRSLLGNPEKYQMSPFEGKEFLHNYKKSRMSKIKHFEKNQNSITKFDNILKIIRFKGDTNIQNKIRKDTIETEELFTFLCSKLEENKMESFLKEIIDVFIKKFEIRKKIFNAYDADFKVASNDFTNLKNYSLFSLICLLEYHKTDNLKYLNTSLKLNDIICSQSTKISSSDDITLFLFIVKKELEFIFVLCDKKKVFLNE